jgi:hypothetical protein
MLAVFVVACSAAPGAAQSPGSVGATPGPEATPGGQATSVPPEPPGGGGNTGGGSGQIHIEIGGPVPMTVDAPFFAIGSRFGGVAGTQLNFTTDGSNAIASITVVEGTVVIGYADESMGANSQMCELSDWNIGATSGSGSFDCKDGFATKVDGTYLTGVTMKGSFQASQ